MYMYKYLFGSPLLTLLDIYIEVGLLGYTVILLLIFWGTTILFPIGSAPFYIPTNRAQGFQFLHILANNYFLFFDSAILIGVRCFATVVLISDVEHLFMCLLAICNIFFRETSI